LFRQLLNCFKKANNRYMLFIHGLATHNFRVATFNLRIRTALGQLRVVNVRIGVAIGQLWSLFRGVW